MGLAHRCLAALLAFMAFTSSVTAAEPDPAGALAAYEQGKQRYDAKDYRGARSKFIEAARLEPANPRWHYNLGLAQRQLGNFEPARQSLLKARELDPEYKRAEIDDKLSAMGFAPGSGSDQAATSPQSPRPADSRNNGGLTVSLLAVIAIAVTAFIALVVSMVRRGVHAAGGKKTPAKRGPPPDPAAVNALTVRLDAAAKKLVSIEHALRLGEHGDLRSRLDFATRVEQALRQHLADAARGDPHAFRKAGRNIIDLEASIAEAVRTAQAAFGDRAFAGAGERVACYFCARPLANPDYRRLVTIKGGTSQTEALSCPPCADLLARGEAPTILAGGDNGQTHWSELPGFDPYAARHAPLQDTRRLPAWRFSPQGSWGGLAHMAGGAALAGGTLASLLRPGQAQAAAPLLDLDAAREAGLAQEAARATAQHAASQRYESFSDHS